MYSFPPRKIPPLEGQWAPTKVMANLGKKSAPVAQGIEHRPPEAGAQVRILPGAQSLVQSSHSDANILKAR